MKPADKPESKPTEYQKRVSAKATVGEAQALAQRAAKLEVLPMLIAMRWVVALSVVSVIVSFVALWVAIR